jgi:hypothetical protein
LSWGWIAFPKPQNGAQFCGCTDRECVLRRAYLKRDRAPTEHQHAFPVKAHLCLSACLSLFCCSGWLACLTAVRSVTLAPPSGHHWLLFLTFPLAAVGGLASSSLGLTPWVGWWRHRLAEERRFSRGQVLGFSTPSAVHQVGCASESCCCIQVAWHLRSPRAPRKRSSGRRQARDHSQSQEHAVAMRAMGA